jgi:hypothetical protein
MTYRDPLSLQSLLFTAVRALGGTWHPAPSAIGDIAIAADESQSLDDGNEMKLRIVITAVGIDTDSPKLHLSHFVSVRMPTHRESIAPSMACCSVWPCAFDSVDSIIEAYDAAAEYVNDRKATMILAVEASRGI